MRKKSYLQICQLIISLKKRYEYIEVKKMKPTARCPVSLILSRDNIQYLLVIAYTETQKYYLDRNIENIYLFEKEIGDGFRYNYPIVYSSYKSLEYAIFQYFTSYKFSDTDIPVVILNDYYSRCITYTLDDELVDRIMADLLSGWPPIYYEYIKTNKLYIKFKEQLQSFQELTIAFEHGDFAKNNIINVRDELYLIDFEFSRKFQPIGLDEYDYKRTTKMQNDDEIDILTKIKSELYDEINNYIDKRERLWRIEIFFLQQLFRLIWIV